MSQSCTCQFAPYDEGCVCGVRVRPLYSSILQHLCACLFSWSLRIVMLFHLVRYCHPLMFVGSCRPSRPDLGRCSFSEVRQCRLSLLSSESVLGHRPRTGASKKHGQPRRSGPVELMLPRNYLLLLKSEVQSFG